jgi:hypothetical protein
MGTMKRKDLPMWAKTGHGKPVTRRDFLAHGIIPFAASALVPGALGLLSGLPINAMADQCAAGAANMATFITVNLSGGASLASNFVPRDMNGQLLPSYSKMGLGTMGNNLPIATEFGVPAFSGMYQGALISGMLTGIRASADASTLGGTAFVGVCIKSQDDSAGNSFDASGMVYRAGKVGSTLPNLGTGQTVTGIRQAAATVAPPPPLIVGSFNDIANSIGYTGALRNSLTTNQKISLTKLVASLSGSQVRKLASINSAAGVQDLVNCAGIKNPSLISAGANLVDPLTNGDGSAVSPIWNGFNASTAANNQDRVLGSMVYNALNGNAGTVSIDLGGYDYHDNTRTTGFNMDKQAGMVIGKILQTAKAMGKPVFVYVTSDGSVVSLETSTPDSPWASDRGTAGAALMFVYHPSGRPQTSGFQIGQFTTGQVVDESYVIGSNPELAAQAVFANYLQFNKSLGLFGSIVGRSALTDGVNGVVKLV